MNQSRPTDSNLSLDAESALSDPAAMIAQPYQLYVERTDPTKNMARYYAMSIEPTLFGEACLTRRWGRIGAGGQKLVHHFRREEEAVTLFLELLRKKRSRGYRPRLHSRQGPLA
ncbi:WGR domain-containing protein [Rhizobium sp. L43]|uniref:WGR domain-containing protein n=1 Tax=Rhizobium sp. L43 TaxID=2035452 RepID=UPI000BE9D962|nr:WGR domain-containing protein [Rhizobium sp. L43]PDS78718.1 WGR domain-containing protein [Rhizobium sp. L43]